LRSTDQPISEPPPEAPQRDDAPKALQRELTGGARIAAVFASWYTGGTKPITPDEARLKELFGYWSRQLRGRVPNPHAELLSELAASNRLDQLVPPVSPGLTNRILRSAYLDILKRLQGRGAARGVNYVDDLKDHTPRQDPMQLRRVLALQEIEIITRGLTPLQKEALDLRDRGLSDEDAAKASMRPCTPVTFRQRVHDAQARARELAPDPYSHSSECQDDKEIP
jgi:hypothetical protein